MATNQEQQQYDDQDRSYYGIRNVRALRGAANDNDPRAAGFTPERRPLPRPATNDNRPARSRASVQKTPKGGRGGRLQAVANSKLASLMPGETRQVMAKGMAITNAISATWSIIGLTWILFLIQLVFAAFELAGFGALVTLVESWLGYADVFGIIGTGSEIFWYIGMGGTLIIGIFTLIIAMAVYLLRGVEMGRGISPIIAAICLCLYLVPVVNLLPWMWGWCVYVIKTQADE